MPRRRVQPKQKGRWQVQRERCRLGPDDHPQAPAPAAAGIESVVARVMKKLGLEERQWFSELLEQWPLLVGPAIAKHARPGGCERETLIVFVDSSPWLSELARYASGEMLQKVQDRFGDARVKRITLRLDPDQGRGRVR